MTNLKENLNENRRSFRINESVLLQYQVIDEADFQKGIERWQIRAGAPSGIRSKMLDLDARLDELLYRVNNDAPAACDALKLLNKKLNFVLEVLPEFRESKEALANQRAQICELSADGMAFGINEILHPQTKLLLRFLLISANRFFETFCRVVRIIDEDDIDACPHSHRVAVAFHGMKATEREILIQHLFSKQSESLRLRRKQSESAA